MKHSAKRRGEALRGVMRHVPYPVAIVTAAAGERIRGITIGSFTSLSMNPPLISFNLEKTAQMHPLLAEASHFAVHIPGANQANLCDRFALPDFSGPEQFDAVEYHRDERGTPILDDVVAVIHCRKYNMAEGGDHSVVMGEVLDVEQNEATRPGILYFEGGYHKLGDRLRGRISAETD